MPATACSTLAASNVAAVGDDARDLAIALVDAEDLGVLMNLDARARLRRGIAPGDGVMARDRRRARDTARRGSGSAHRRRG